MLRKVINTYPDKHSWIILLMHIRQGIRAGTCIICKVLKWYALRMPHAMYCLCSVLIFKFRKRSAKSVSPDFLASFKIRHIQAPPNAIMELSLSPTGYLLWVVVRLDGLLSRWISEYISGRLWRKSEYCTHISQLAFFLSTQSDNLTIFLRVTYKKSRICVDQFICVLAYLSARFLLKQSVYNHEYSLNKYV